MYPYKRIHNRETLFTARYIWPLYHNPDYICVCVCVRERDAMKGEDVSSFYVRRMCVQAWEVTDDVLTQNIYEEIKKKPLFKTDFRFIEFIEAWNVKC